MKTVERNAHNMYYARVYLLERDPSSKFDSESPVETVGFSCPAEHPEISPQLFAPTSLLPGHTRMPRYSPVRDGRQERRTDCRVPPGLAHIDQRMMVL